MSLRIGALSRMLSYATGEMPGWGLMRRNWTAYSDFSISLGFLRIRKIMFQITQQRDDAVMVSFALVGLRVEAEFFQNEVEFSTFKGDESVSADLDTLHRMIDANWD